MKKLVYVTTFRRNENQGEVIPVVTTEIEVYIEVMPVTARNGCLSTEIHRGREVQFVRLCGRDFVTGKGWGTDFDQSGAELRVSVTWEVAEKLLS